MNEPDRKHEAPIQESLDRVDWLASACDRVLLTFANQYYLYHSFLLHFSSPSSFYLSFPILGID